MTGWPRQEEKDRINRTAINAPLGRNLGLEAME